MALGAVEGEHRDGRPPRARGTRAPVFVIGYQRSGTTLTQALLGCHPAIAAPPEMYFFYRVAAHRDHFGDLADDASLGRALHEALNPPVDILAGCEFDHDALLARVRAGPRTYAALFDAIMSDFAERAGKPRWSDKSPGQSIDAVRKLFPDAQYVHIVRDPRDVVASSIRTPWTDPDPAAIARSWREFTLHNIRLGLEVGPSQFLQIRYEDLTRDPEAVLRVVCAFLHEDYAPEMVRDASLRRGAVPDAMAAWQGRALDAIEPWREGAWEQHLGPVAQLRVHAVVGRMLGPLGYRLPSRPSRACASAFALGELVRKGARRLWPERKLTPERRYALSRRFLERQAGRVTPDA